MQLPVQTQVTDESGAVYTETYTNIRTGAEPAADLFRVPDGYREADPASEEAPANDVQQTTCPLQNDDPVILTSFDGVYWDSRFVNARTEGFDRCAFVFDQALFFEYPLDGYPNSPLFLPTDQWAMAVLP